MVEAAHLCLAVCVHAGLTQRALQGAPPHTLFDIDPDVPAAGSFPSVPDPPARDRGRLCLVLAIAAITAGSHTSRNQFSLSFQVRPPPPASCTASGVQTVYPVFSSGTSRRLGLMSVDMASDVVHMVICFILQHTYDGFKNANPVLLLLTRDSMCLSH